MGRESGSHFAKRVRTGPQQPLNSGSTAGPSRPSTPISGQPTRPRYSLSRMTTTLAIARTLPASDLYMVVASLESTDGRFLGWTAVEAPCTYDEALTRRDQHAAGRRLARTAGRVRRLGRVREYAVRSLADPRFAPLVSRPYESARTRKHPERTGTQSGEVKAAMAWAADHGYHGGIGGWIYGPDGEPVVQGWFQFALGCRSAGRIAADQWGRWYVLDLPAVA
jgi:hypothetical protein